jgi:hypothetical protein
MATAPIKLPDIMSLIGAPAGANAGDVQLAKDQLAMDIAPQQQGITSTINTINQYLERDVSAQQQYGQVADQKIAGIGNELAGKLQENVGAIGGIYDTGVGKIGSTYDEASTTLGNIGQSVQSQLSARAGSLGQTQALKADTQYGTDPLSRLQTSLAQMQGRAASGKASGQANLAALGTQLKGIAQKTVGDSERDYAQKRSDVATQVLKVIGQLQITAGENIMTQLQKFSTLAETAGPAFRTLLNQATSARTKAEREDAKDQLTLQLKMMDMGMKQEKHNLDVYKATKEDDPNSLDNLIKRNTLEKGDKELGRGQYISDSEGHANLMRYLGGVVRKDRGSPGISGTAHAGIQNFINQNLGATQMSGMYNTTDPVKILASIAQQNIDPKTGKVKLPISGGSKYKQEDYQIDFPTLLDALTARFTNVGTSAKVGGKI